jgi:hypothetical protein
MYIYESNDDRVSLLTVHSWAHVRLFVIMCLVSRWGCGTVSDVPVQP